MYYQTDDVLCDEDEKPIPNYRKVVGEIIFNHGSLDPSICYIRSEQIMHEWEIILDEGSFAQEILGITVEEQWGPTGQLKHTNLRKFRLD